MFSQTLHCERKPISHYCFHCFGTGQTLERHGCFEINGKQIIKMAKKGETVEVIHDLL